MTDPVQSFQMPSVTRAPAQASPRPKSEETSPAELAGSLDWQILSRTRGWAKGKKARCSESASDR